MVTGTSTTQLSLHNDGHVPLVQELQLWDLHSFLRTWTLTYNNGHVNNLVQLDTAMLNCTCGTWTTCTPGKPTSSSTHQAPIAHNTGTSESLSENCTDVGTTPAMTKHAKDCTCGIFTGIATTTVRNCNCVTSTVFCTENQSCTTTARQLYKTNRKLKNEK